MVVVVKRTPQEWLELVKTITDEGPLSLPKAARLVKANSKSGHASVNTLMRWIINGRRGIFLEGCRLNGHQWSTSRQAILRFQAAQTDLVISRFLEKSREHTSTRTDEMKGTLDDSKTRRTLDRLQKMKPKRR